MTFPAKKPELSVIVPVYNEAGVIEGLFRTLKAQEGVAFELIVCDGGSTDATVTQTWSLGEDAPFPVSVIHCDKGRGRQLNAGAAASCGDTILFLHADSSFAAGDALKQGMQSLDKTIAARGDDRVAGHFALHFLRNGQKPSFGYHYLESKARLSRRHCIHGDQCFLLRRAFFRRIGPFEEPLPFLEDTRFAEAVTEQGEWILLPAIVQTSARRFETEGFMRRQTLNAVVLNLLAIDREDFLLEIPCIYATQDRAGELQLLPFFQLLRSRIADLPWRERLKLWLDTGRYVRDNAWQLALALDIWRNHKRGYAAGEGTLSILHFYDRLLDRLSDHAPGRLTAMALVRIWFELSSLVLRLEQRSSGI
ncbi:TIGR04283 family arsenosugar biosynthesis glycosyltransferase [Geotalea sp. SG265]|uniref:TIGR04283 family arsenosugar biosynthesis glycosyltransferase n=1 Tax=Geotalea sp. SG265 TaxID=2922867 RepID=UPI001FAF3AF5|nr:TIGR04283 family arsenosugar biosynthesis glycosyltransferase [Geotalea sp. SG265]